MLPPLSVRVSDCSLVPRLPGLCDRGVEVPAKQALQPPQGEAYTHWIRRFILFTRACIRPNCRRRLSRPAMVHTIVLNRGGRGLTARSTGCGQRFQARATGLSGLMGPKLGWPICWTRQKALLKNGLPPRSSGSGFGLGSSGPVYQTSMS
jgi:hypothetical protein